jgi:hypothetical protein
MHVAIVADDLTLVSLFLAEQGKEPRVCLHPPR